MIKNYFKIALRNLRKNKDYGLLNIFGLAVGIACAGLILLWTENELSWDSNNIKKDKLYAIRENISNADNIFTLWSTPRVMAAAVKAEIPGIANVCRISEEPQNLLISAGDKSMYSAGRYADSSLFNMLTLPFLQGSKTTAFSQLHSIVLTQTTSIKFFGDINNVIGKTVRIDNKQDYVITGVIKDLPQNSTLQFDWLIPFENDPDYDLSWNSYGPHTYVELNKSTNVSLVNKQLYNYIHQKDPSQTTHAFLFPMSDWHLYDEFENGKQTGGGRIEQIRTLSIVALIILLIACINFMNLVTASSERRAKEVGVRKVMGSGRGKLISQFVIEAILMSFLAAVLALFIIDLSLPAFNTLVQKQLTLQLNNPVHIIALLAIIIVCGLIAGSYPSFYLTSFSPVGVLKGLKIKTGSATAIRKGLVIMQFTVSVIFIISTIVVYKQIQHTKNRQLGFNKNNLIEIDMQQNVSNIFPVIKQDLLQTGFITNAAMSDHATIYGGNSDGRFRWQGKSITTKTDITFRNVSPEFISVSGMKIIAGRDFRQGEGFQKSDVIVTQSLAKLISKQNVVGQVIQSARGNKDGRYTNNTIVGVIDDYVYGNVYGKPGPVLFFCRPPEDANLIYVRIKPGSDINDALKKIQAVMEKDNPLYPFSYQFVDDQFNKMFADIELTSKMSTIFAGLAIMISCMGLFGLAAYTVERRRKEIGVRKVLGASVTGITKLLSKDFLKLILLSCLIAFPVAWWIMNKWLQNFAYRINISLWVFILSGIVAMIIVLLTIGLHAIKAATANPIKSLRYE